MDTNSVNDTHLLMNKVNIDQNNVKSCLANAYSASLFHNALEFNDNVDLFGVDLLVSEEDYKKNPRSIIRFLRGKTYYYYHIETAFTYFIVNNNKLDPYTRKEMSRIDIERIKAYNEYYSKYKNIVVTTTTIRELLYNLFKSNKNQIELQNTISLARGIIQPEDIVEYISNNINAGNRIDRAFTEIYLKNKPIDTCIFRNSSISSTDYAKVFIMSITNPKGIVHIPYVHIYGRGLFEMISIQITQIYKLPENPDAIPILYDKAYVSIIDLLLDPKFNLFNKILKMDNECLFY